ncbi:hypothetical protein O9422_18450, partial [Proteus mirabilis]|uniref:hypothetical protein n=1 Tax=Proteus mirabilis TaxID=584 RepID=UPI002576AA8C
STLNSFDWCRQTGCRHLKRGRTYIIAAAPLRGCRGLPDRYSALKPLNTFPSRCSAFSYCFDTT